MKLHVFKTVDIRQQRTVISKIWATNDVNFTTASFTIMREFLTIAQGKESEAEPGRH